jgi:hypothetical protein
LAEPILRVGDTVARGHLLAILLVVGALKALLFGPSVAEIVTGKSRSIRVLAKESARVARPGKTHVAIFFFVPVDWAPSILIFSSIFSHTRGTPRKMVGRTSLSVAGSEPLRASGWANQVVPAQAMGA